MPELPQQIPAGAYTGEDYAVFAWDRSDRTAECEYAGPALSSARAAIRTLESADPPYDFVKLVKRTVEVGPWRCADENLAPGSSSKGPEDA